MKAYYLSVANDDEGLVDIVFANTSKEAKKLIDSTDIYYENWIDVRVNRAPKFDGMEKLSARELARETWREGWRWYDERTPDPSETTDEEFYEWYDNTLGGK